MLYGTHPLIQNGRKAKRFREKHGIIQTSLEGLFVTSGYHDIKWIKGVRRTFADVNATYIYPDFHHPNFLK